MANERSHMDIEEISKEEIERKFFDGLLKEAVDGNPALLKRHNKKVLREVERRLDDKYGETFTQLKETASPDQRELIDKLNELRRASDSVRTLLGWRHPGPALRLDKAPVAPNAPMPSKGNR